MATQTTELDESVSNGDLLVEETSEPESSGPGDPVATGERIEVVEGIEMPFEPEAAPAPPRVNGLRDAAEASFPPPFLPESLIEEDNRRRITTTDTYPWRVHCALSITANDGRRWIGTAFFIGRRILATAGHNLFMHAPGRDHHGWVRSIDVMPGRDGDDMPFGTTVSSRFYSVKGWTEQRNTEYDYGAIILPKDYENQTGWLGFGAYSDNTLTSSTGNLSGYPSDRGSGAEQWYMARQISSVGTRKVFYDIDTFAGQSGSAVYRIVDGQRHAFGIHAYGVGRNPLNSATRINQPVFDNLQKWKNDHN